ncbi:MAG: hypothetical protein ACRELB_23870 [Polyangiaceae bacterium]
MSAARAPAPVDRCTSCGRYVGATWTGASSLRRRAGRVLSCARCVDRDERQRSPLDEAEA